MMAWAILFAIWILGAVVVWRSDQDETASVRERALVAVIWFIWVALVAVLAISALAGLIVRRLRGNPLTR
jgi:hypothetical protein